MKQHNPEIPCDDFPLFHPTVGEVLAEALAAAAGLEIPPTGTELAEVCPKCNADPGDLCESRGKAVTTHHARSEVATLRYSRGWIPKTGDEVLVGSDLHGAWRARFAWFTADGHARLDLPAKGNGQGNKVEIANLWPLEWGL